MAFAYVLATRATTFPLGAQITFEFAAKGKRGPVKLVWYEGNHQRDWLDAVRKGRQAASPFEYGGRLSEIGLLGVIAVRMSGQKLAYDEKAMRFTNNDEANRWLNPPFRSGWSLA